MGRLSTIIRTFTGKSKNLMGEATAVAVSKCNAAISVLESQDIQLQTKIRLAEEEARALLRMGDRSGAETSLKKKELMIRESERIQTTKVSLLSQILLVETAETRATAVDALATGLSVHKQMSAKMFNEVQLEKLQDDLLEQACFEADVANLMSQSFDAITSFDDETNVGLEKALDNLQAEEIGNTVNMAIENLSETEVTLEPIDIEILEGELASTKKNYKFNSYRQDIKNKEAQITPQNVSTFNKVCNFSNTSNTISPCNVIHSNNVDSMFPHIPSDKGESVPSKRIIPLSMIDESILASHLSE